jgi:flagellin-like hook-associated protein FlgL
MRLTDNMITGNYLRSLNRNSQDLNDLNTKISAGRKFMKMSEDPASAVKAFDVRKDLTQGDLYASTLGDSQALLDEAETSLSSISETATNALTTINQGINGSLDASDRSTIANTLRSYQQMILGAANVKASDRYLFGGSGFGSTPFTLDGSGNLLYNGQSVDTGTFSQEHRYVDIGLGLTVSGGGTVSSQTALDVAYSGADLLGTGTDASGLPNNLYSLIGKIADKIEAGDTADIKTYVDKLEQSSDSVRMQYVAIGEKSNYISFFTDRLSSEKITSTEKQNDLEGLTIEEGAIQYAEQQNMYNACLQMGTKLIQPSLLDYLD